MYDNYMILVTHNNLYNIDPGGDPVQRQGGAAERREGEDGG